jgi:hypothetical protein
MNKLFAASLQQPIAVSAQLLSWAPDAFWRSTPAELSAALQDPSAPHADPVSWSDIQHLLEREKDD